MMSAGYEQDGPFCPSVAQSPVSSTDARGAARGNQTGSNLIKANQTKSNQMGLFLDSSQPLKEQKIAGLNTVQRLAAKAGAV